jgi:hypothetical protein
MSTRILGPTRSKRRRRFMLVPVLLASGLMTLFFAGSARGIHDLALFELDRNALDVVATPGDDWNTLNNGGGNAALQDFTGVLPDISAADSEQFQGGGSKDNNDISQWLWKAGEPLDKDDITNAYTASYIAPTTVGGTTAGDLILYYGLDRFANNGTAQVGFWFFQNKIAKTDTAAGGGFKFDGVHEVGDVLVQSNFTSGGRVSSVSVFEWVGSGGSNGSLNLLFAGTDCVDADPNTPGDQPLLGDDPACATANIANETSPWSYTPKAGTANVFPLSSFFEGGVNISRLLPTDVGCFPTFMAETRSSAPFDSRLKDFQLGNFQQCETTVTTSPSDADGIALDSITLGDSIYDTALIQGSGSNETPTGTVDFWLCAPDELTNGACEEDANGGDTGTLISEDVAVDPHATIPNAGVAMSGEATPDSLGTWCWRGEYSGDDNYPPGMDASTGECFEVTDTSSILTDQAWTPNDSATITSAGGSTLKGTLTITMYNNATCTAGDSDVNVLYQESFAVQDASGDPVASPVTKATTNGDGSGTGLAADKVFHEADSPVTVSWKAVFDSSIGDSADSEGPCETSSNLAIDDNDPPTP